MPNLPMSVLTVPTEIEGEVVPTSYEIKDANARTGVTASVELLKDTAGWTGKNRFNYKNAVNATNVVADVDMASGDISIKDVTAQWSSTYIGYIDIENGKTYKLVADKVATYGRFGFSTSASLYPQSGSFPDDMITFSGTSPQTVVKILFDGDVSITAKTSGRLYMWFCSDENYQESHQAYTIKIMIEDAATFTLSPSYEPYHDTVEAELAKKANAADVTAIAEVIPSSATSSNKVATAQDVTATVDLLKDTTGWLGGNEIDSSKGTGASIFTLNSDNTVTANGTGGVSNSQFTIPINVSGDFYFLGCPEGGAVNKYDIYIYDITTGARVKKWDGVTQSESNYGNAPTECKIPEGHEVIMQLRVFANFSVSNIVFKPMLITAEQYALNPSYRPYHGSVEEVKADKSEVQATISLLKDTTGWLGGNICKRFSSQAKNGGTLTVDPNTGICSLSGTTSAQTSFLVEQSLKAGTYILDGAPTSGSSIGSYDMLVVNMDESSLPTIARDYAGVTTEKKFTLTTDTNVRIMCRVPQGALDTTKKFAPMILTEEQYNFNPTYRPYHSTAEEEIQASISLLDNTTGWIGKNHFNGKATSKTAQGVTWVIDANDNNIVTVSGTPTGFEPLTVDSKKVLPVGEYVLSGISDMVNVVYNGVFLYKNDVRARDLQIADDNAPRTFSILQSDDYDTIRVQLKRATNGVACSGTGKIMITTPEEYKLSPTYEPYHESVEEMLATKNVTVTGDIVATGNYANVVKIVNMVIGSFYAGNLTAVADTWLKIGNISEHPKYNTNFASALVNGDYALESQIDTQGDVYVRSHTGGTISVRGGFVYVV